MAQPIALVTGGTGGIGTAICRALADQGVKVVAGYNSGGNHAKAKAWQEQQKADGYDILVSYGDVTDSESCKICVEQITELAGGNIDILINNAGILYVGEFYEMDESSIEISESKTTTKISG